MSTILDALRKLEEERHSRTADARSRLLLSPPQQAHLRKRRQASEKSKRRLFSVVGVLLAGFSAGAGLVFWRSHSPATPPPTAMTAAPPQRYVKIQEVVPTREISNKKQFARKTEPVAQTSSPDLHNNALPPAASEAPDSSPPSLQKEQEPTLADISALRRSPFVAAPPVPRESTPAQRESKQTVKRPPPPSLAPSLNPQQADAPYKVLLPNGATRTVGAPMPSPTTETASTAASGTSLSFLQWSNEPDRRIAFLRVNGGPLTMAHEGDTVGGYTVVEIRQNEVELRSGETRMTLRP